jgi:hypothetical protein
MIKMLNLKSAIQLYEILEPYLDILNEDTTFIEVAMSIITKSTENNDGAYARSLVLITGHTFEELAEFSPEYNIEMFLKGLRDNHIYELKAFCERLNNGR